MPATANPKEQPVVHSNGDVPDTAVAVVGEVLPARDLAGIATDLRHEVEHAETHMAKALDHAFRAGHLLHEAKALCKHGEWLPWVEANFPGTRNTATNYMRLAEHENEVRATGEVRVRDALRHLTSGTRASDTTKPKDPEPTAETKAAVKVFASGIKRELDAANGDTRKLVPVARSLVRTLGAEVAGYLALTLADEVKKKTTT